MVRHRACDNGPDSLLARDLPAIGRISDANNTMAFPGTRSMLADPLNGSLEIILMMYLISSPDPVSGGRFRALDQQNRFPKEA
jgi:hypothetical protein